MYDSHITFIRQSLLIANNALMGQTEHLFIQFGEDKDIILDGIVRRADRYQAVIDDDQSNGG